MENKRGITLPVINNQRVNVCLTWCQVNLWIGFVFYGTIMGFTNLPEISLTALLLDDCDRCSKPVSNKRNKKLRINKCGTRAGKNWKSGYFCGVYSKNIQYVSSGHEYNEISLCNETNLTVVLINMQSVRNTDILLMEFLGLNHTFKLFPVYVSGSFLTFIQTFTISCFKSFGVIIILGPF